MGCSRGVPGLFRGVPGCSEGVPGMFRGFSGVFRGVPGVFRVLQTPIKTQQTHSRLFSIEFQFHRNTHIMLWLTVVPTLERHSCVARASEIPVESFRCSSTNKEK